MDRKEIRKELCRISYIKTDDDSKDLNTVMTMINNLIDEV